MAACVQPSLRELPYFPNSAELFEPVADQAWSMLLDSAGFGGPRGRYDILVADPVATLVTEGSSTTITVKGAVSRSDANPLDLLRTSLARWQPARTGSLPFAGGAVGYFAYDLAWYLGEWPQRAHPDHGMPEMAMGIYDWAVVVDHQERRSWFTAAHGFSDRVIDWYSRWAAIRAPVTRRREPLRAMAPLVSNLSEAQYRERFERVRRYLTEGDCYQVNLAQTFSAPVTGDPFAGYRHLRETNSAPFSAYLNLPAGQVLSASPERFLLCREGSVETRPIKGTRPRGAEPATDRALAEELASSDKDRAENLMIVDLLRNDLGKQCRTGSIRVPELFQIESFASVHHLVSSVVGELAPDSDPLQLLAGAFPGGSITGAPKRRAMEIIDELEPQPRGIYCGAIGYLGFDGRMDTSIAIRTLVVHEGEVRFSAGGGLVIDSDPGAEYRETLAKAQRLRALFGA